MRKKAIVMMIKMMGTITIILIMETEGGVVGTEV